MMNQNKEIIKKERDSNMELLRMVAMFMVLLVHADYFALGAPSVEYIQTNQADSFLRIFFEAVSIVCVNVFVLISGYYGIRPTFKGGVNFVFQCLFFFVVLYIATLIIGTNELSLGGLAGCIFATKSNWFIKAYLLLYLISPILNKFVSNAERSEFKWVLIGFFLFVCTYGWIGAADFICSGYSTLFFIGLYLLARYVKIYSPKWAILSKKKDFTIYLSVTSFVVTISFITPLLLNRNFPLYIWAYNSPTTIVAALFLLLAFSKIRLQNKFINWCGMSCFAVYLMHTSPNILWHFKDLFVMLHNSMSVFEYWVSAFLILVMIFFISIFIDKMRIICWEYCWNRYLSVIDVKLK
jgi:surface polysaccharide O-acyltransferase-like enzyme